MSTANYLLGFNEDGFNEGGFGGAKADLLNAAIENVDNDALIINRDDDTYNLLRTLLLLQYSIRSHTDALHDSLFIDIASGEQLNKRGREVGIYRKQGDNDDRHRKRVRTGFGRATSDTTYTTVAQLALDVLDTDSSNVALDLKPVDAPEVDLKTFQSVIDDNPLAQTEIENELKQSVAGGHALNIKAFGTFELKSDSYSPPSGTGLGDGTLKGEI